MKYQFAAIVLTALPALAMGQTSGNPNAGLTVWNDFVCASCHSLASLRTQIIARSPNAGTLNFAKSLNSLNTSLSGTDLDGVATGMSGYSGLLSTTQRGDLSAYIAGSPAAAPTLTYAPNGGAVFSGTAVGATSTAVVTITNTGTASLAFNTNNAITIVAGGDASDFRVTSSNCPGMTLQPNQGNCTINVSFQPAAGASTTRSASMNLAHTAGTSVVPMSGTVGAGSVTTPPVGNPAPAPTPPSSGSAQPVSGLSAVMPTSSANAPLNGGAGSLPATVVALLFAVALRRRAG